MKIATTLLSTSGKTCVSSEHLWLRLQILISAGDLDEAYRLAKEEGFCGGLVRAWHRMECVPVIFKRMIGKGKEPDWDGEWEDVARLLRENSDT